ncbi:MAG TPA: hypothetical protein VN037_11630 [Verrucomicrobiae bacterium]|nr:hypothetical protein [Verrucomicrobiae bacterium]
MRLKIRAGNRLVYAAVLLTMAGMCASFLSKTTGAQDEGGGWRIVRAQYGWRDRQTDVTDLVRDLIGRGGANGRVFVNNQTMGGDPAVSQDKVLLIIARNQQNQEREFSYREGAAIDVRMFAVRRDDFDDRPQGNDRHDDRRDDRRGVSILRAYWGVQGRTANVTDLLRNMQRENGLQVMANNRALGGDPAPGADKVLIVVYRVQGQETAAAVREGNILTIP